MGIRFYCPNGHKLNVKEHLAGKAGFCPECGARLIIPFQSTRKSSKELAAEAAAQPEQPKPLESPTESPKILIPSWDNTPEPAVKPATEQIASEFVNPILQDKSVVWYIQVPGGQQYGPATGDVVHTWVKERRISSTMLVWREGWENWLEAKNVFPELE